MSDYKIIDFEKFCKSCTHSECDENSYPCDLCLSTPARIGGSTPLYYKKDTSFTSYYAYKQKIYDYLHYVRYDRALDYEYANRYFKDNNPISGGYACSSMRKDALMGRNYDWYYSEYPTFVISTERLDNRRNAVLGVGCGFNGLTEKCVDEKNVNELYRVLPFILLDGINDKGVACSVNMVPADDAHVATDGTKPIVELRKEISIMMLNRWMLDTFDSATDAVTYLQNYVSVYSYPGFEAHFIIADHDSTYIIEFMDDETIIHNVTNDRPYITNFYITDAVFNAETHLLDRNTITPHGSGLERYELISKKYDNVHSFEDMVDLLGNDLRYTRTYNSNTMPFWYTEYVGGDLTVFSPKEDFAPIVEKAREYYVNRDRKSKKTWHTMHTSIYDLDRLALYIFCQEDYTIAIDFYL